MLSVSSEPRCAHVGHEDGGEDESRNREDEGEYQLLGPPQDPLVHCAHLLTVAVLFAHVTHGISPFGFVFLQNNLSHNASILYNKSQAEICFYLKPGIKWPYCAGGGMVDTLALGASAERHGGSSPLPRTI